MSLIPCECWSVGTGGDSGTPNVILDRPDFMAAVESKPQIAIDACIVEQVKTLWAAGVTTYSSCCGHGKTRPSVVVDAGKALSAKALLTMRDPKRNWRVYYWSHELMEC